MEIAIEKRNIQENHRDSMLWTLFWKYLANNDLKIVTRIHFKTATSSEQLRRKVRQEVEEMKLTKPLPKE